MFFKCIEAIKQVNESITNVEARHNVTSSDVTMAKDRLNFGLVEVVYEWARNKVNKMFSLTILFENT